MPTCVRVGAPLRAHLSIAYRRQRHGRHQPSPPLPHQPTSSQKLRHSHRNRRSPPAPTLAHAPHSRPGTHPPRRALTRRRSLHGAAVDGQRPPLPPPFPPAPPRARAPRAHHGLYRGGEALDAPAAAATTATTASGGRQQRAQVPPPRGADIVHTRPQVRLPDGPRRAAAAAAAVAAAAVTPAAPARGGGSGDGEPTGLPDGGAPAAPHAPPPHPPEPPQATARDVGSPPPPGCGHKGPRSGRPLCGAPPPTPPPVACRSGGG